MNKTINTISTSLILILLMTGVCGCKTQTTSQTALETTTQTASYSQYIINFLDDAKNSYTSGVFVDGSQLSTSINGISDSDFLSLSVKSDTSMLMGGQLYSCHVMATTQQMIASEIKLGDYNVEYSDPTPGATGGTPTLVQVYEGTKLIGDFTTWEIGFQISNYAVYINAYNVGNLTFLFMYYTKAPGNYERLWLILSPT